MPRLAVALACLLSLSHLSSAQKLTLRGKGLAITTVFSEIQRQLGYEFVYSPRIIDDAPKVDLDCRNAEAREVLTSCFAGLQLGWTIAGKTITVYRKVPLAASLYTPLQGRLLSIDGEPLEGASISIDSLAEGRTRAGGFFHIPVHSHLTKVSFSFLGYSSRTLGLSNTVFHNVGLQSSAFLLDHVVVQAYGRTTQRLVTGSQSGVAGADVNNQPIGNVLAGLTGRAPGLDIRQYNGVPGSAYGILIRGRHSIAQGTDPLIIINGMPIAGNNGSLSTIGSGSAQGPLGAASLNSIPVSAIASIQVLKDASATAIYGSRGANGVILLTLKQGQVGQPKWHFDLYGGPTQAVKTSPLLTTAQYRAIREEAIHNDGGTVDATTAPELFNWDSSRYTDFKRQVLGHMGMMKDARVELCGGDTNTIYLVSGNYHSERSVFPGSTGNDRKSLYGQLHHVGTNKRLKIDLTGLYSWGNTNLPIQDYTLFQALGPNAPPFRTATGALQWQYNGLSYANIDALAYNQYHASLNNQFNFGQIGYTVVPGLELKGSLGYNRIVADEHSRQPLAGQDPATHPTGARFYTGNTYHSIMGEGLADYSTRMGPGKLDALLGVTWQEQTTAYSALGEDGFTSDLQLSTGGPVAGVTANSETNEVVYRYEAVFGRLNYAIKNRYLFTASGRRDGSSRFGPGKQFGNFWAVSGAWIFSDEPFVQRWGCLSWGKLRGSIGTTGNDQIGNNLFAQVYSNTTSTRGYQGLQGVYPVTFANDNLAWEVNYNSELALDLGFWKNKLMFTVAVYRDWTVNQLLYTSLPFQAGLPGVFSNQPANVVNKGLEFSLQTHNIVSKNFRWTSSFYLTAPFNQLKKFPELGSSLYAARLYMGKSLTEIRGYHYTGVDTKTGLFTFQDYKNNGLDPSDLVAGGNLDPKLYGGIGQNFQYKGWQLDLFFEYRIQDGVNPFVAWYQLNSPGMQGPSMLNNGPVEWLKHWQRPGDVAPLQRLTADPASAAARQISNYVGSDARVMNASYLRWKSMSLSRKLPERWMTKIGLRSGRLYLRGQNLLTVTNFPVADPETQNPTVLPPVRTLVTGVQFTL